MILSLNKYWAAQGCVLWLPSNTEVGAGTMNGATFLRVLGPEPWNAAYVEPSVRPDDSRYGENPNRVQQHLQYQVILKPDPGVPQELYLGSLEALGIDRGKHDVRFVEDNWESPALGAWGLGWEVWLDGQEITQFTYFQQAGGLALDPVAVEITYGLERIAMPLQRARHFKDIRYSPGLTYGELLAQNEYEMSVYNLDAAEPSRLGQIFALYEQEAKMLLGAGLVLPGYSYVLKCSHVFNVLDARGAVGVTERAAYFARIRDLARDAAHLWFAKREEQGFPLAKRSSDSEVKAAAVGEPITVAPDVAPVGTFVLELGTEELPATDLDSALQQLRDRLTLWLAERRLAHGNVTIEGTPRRLALIVRNLRTKQSDEMRVARGPAERVAFDESGQPTKAAAGFARSQGIDVNALQVEDFEGGRYVIVHRSIQGRPTADVLLQDLPGLIASLQFPKSMRWNASNVAFSRPLRWFVALFGDEVVPFEYAGVRSGRRSRGRRCDGSPEFDVPSAEVYPRLLESAGIVLDRGRRAATIRERGTALAASVGGTLPEEESLLAEVTNLVEAPTPLLGQYGEQYLSLPREVLVTVMRKHQRYFPVESAVHPGQLLPRFIAVANGNVDEDAVRQGNEDVLAARYADASFFWEHDRTQPLEAWRPRLAGLTFQSKLGSMLDKSDRIERLTPRIAAMLDVPDEEIALARRVAHLSKADLVTHMVVEFTNLQGVMGREYASHSGEPASVAQGIFEHYLPRFAGDALPESPAAIIVGVADRLDSLVGLFAVGLAPRATADPFALRRAALGLVQILAERHLDLDLRAAIAEVAGVQPVDVAGQVREEVLVFIRRRLEQWLLDRGARPDIVQAVLVERGDNPALAVSSVQELGRLADEDRFQRVLKAYARAAKIVRGKDVTSDMAPDLFESEPERRLWAVLSEVAASVKVASTVSQFLDAFEPLVDPIDAFFDSVFVMADQENVRTNRLALLRRVSDLPRGIVDLTQVRGS